MNTSVWYILAILLYWISPSFSRDCSGNELEMCMNQAKCVVSDDNKPRCLCTSLYTGPNCGIGIRKYYGLEHIWYPDVNRTQQKLNRVGTNALGPTDNLTLNCPLLNNPQGAYQFDWYINGTLLTSGKNGVTINHQTGNLHILNPSKDRNRFEGSYYCIVTSDGGKMRGPTIEVKVKVMGRFLSSSPITLNVTTGARLVLKCPSHTYSYGVTYGWIGVTSREPLPFMIQTNRVFQDSDGTLYFSQVTNQDIVNINITKGIQCRMIGFVADAFSNSVFLEGVRVLKSEKTGSFNFPTTDVNMYVAKGDITTLHCIPFGVQPIVIKWYKDSKPLVAGGPLALQKANRTLQITATDSKTAGTYRVEVMANSSSKTFANIKLHYINYKGTYLTAKHKDSVIFNCHIKPFSISTFPFKWYFNGAPVDSYSQLQSRSTVYSNGSLSVTSLLIEDSGIFECYIDGKESIGYAFFVVGLPLPPISLNITNCSSLTTTLSWDVIKTPSFPAESYVLEIGDEFTPNVYKTINSIKITNKKHTIKDLSPGAKLRFRVRGRNNLGIGLPSKPSSLCITTQGKPTKFPDGLKAQPHKTDGSISVEWKSFPQIDWNGAGCVILPYTKRNNESTWKPWQRSLCDATSIVITNMGTYQLTDIRIQIRNNIGTGPFSPKVTSYSGQPAPRVAPKNLRATGITDNSVSLQWDRVVIIGGSVDRYVVTYQPGGIEQPKKRRRRSVKETIIEAWYRLLSKISPRHRIRRANLIGPILPQPIIPQRINTTTTHVTISGLKPYSPYVFTVQAENSGGMGPGARFPVTTLYNKDVFFLLSITFTNVNFTTEYKNKNSLKYRNLSDTINAGLNNMFRNIFHVSSFEVLSFSSGSIVADIQITSRSNSPNGVEFRVPVLELAESQFKPYILNPTKTKMIRESNRLPSNISVSNDFPSAGDTIEFKCVALPTGPRKPTFSWLKDNRLVLPGVRHKIASNDKESTLTIRKIDPTDAGAYQCNLRKSNDSDSSKKSILVVKPVISIVPKALTKVEGDSAIFSCRVISGNVTAMKLLLVRVGDTPKVIDVNNATLTNLKISNGNDSETMRYQCLLVRNESLVNNPVTVSQVAELTIVKPIVPKCPREIRSNVLWFSTAVGLTDIKRCPNNATGLATRRCLKGPNSEPKWDDPNFGNCTSVEFKKLLLQAEAIVSPDYTPTYNASGLLGVLKNTTKKEGLVGGDLDVSVKILTILTNSSQVSNKTTITSDKDQQNFLEICSNILESTNTKRWIQYDAQLQKGTKYLWNRLISTVDSYGLQLTNQIAGSKKVITTRNVVMRLDKVGQQDEVAKKGLQFQYKKFESSLYIPASVFGNGQGHRVVSLVYKTLNAVMRLKNDTNTTQDDSDVLTANTTMVTSLVIPAPTDKLKDKVKIVVKNERVVNPVPQRTCVFWKQGLPSIWKTDGCRLVPSESNSHVTTCECDHLTVFASLMDPYGGPVGEDDRKALELISTIGCGISLFAILLTIVVTLFFWRVLKSPRTIVLMNICVAIGIVCILVIAEGTARATKVGCTVLAVLLHYFLLAVFCWFLCEGLLLYLLIVKVIGGKVEEKVKFFMLFGWGFPLLTVAISLGATQIEGYGYHGLQTACWLSVDNGLIWAFIGPAVVIMLINMVVFVLVIRQMMGTRHAQSKSRDEKLRMGVKATAVILPLLGITWVFGLLAFNTATLAFKYIFAILNSLQGLMIFIFHCVLNQQVKDAVKRRFNQYSSSDSSGPKSSPGRKRKKLENQSGTNSNSESAGNTYEMMRKRESKSELINEMRGVASSNIDVSNLDETRKNESKQNDNEPVYTDIEDPQGLNPPSPADASYYENLALDDHIDSTKNGNGFQDDEEKQTIHKDSQFNAVDVDAEICNGLLDNLKVKSIKVKSADVGSPPLVSRENSLTSDADSQSNFSSTNQGFEQDDTGSFFDYGVPLSGYSSDVSWTQKEKSTDDDDSLASYTVKHERKHSESSTDTMMGEDEFERYLQETNSVSNEYRPSKHVFDSNSSSSSDEDIVYDLVSKNRKQPDDENQGVVLFLGQGKFVEI
ncbi:uncharacterized protein LOC110252281 [Exaiptasia diaphana]|uniref:Uncharacterized protein n=1 Tax=Exaiptasia diaphana TaxID=2652724 RepID=A0A913Y4S0_EXADI|nr:uncharacterized protein LOC110252281 [Exaiptasia diaphana]XP_020914726.1 uncharacterized protein LOC110252281 [Exaiptasia diaphana]XP_028518974.1 uncharacterized protein LOC110252281 [Exaiptasia diaphana]KXJ29080.1 Brain-specific angiogenesis inhibitor 3 [Exaiptasia diaphana]